MILFSNTNNIIALTAQAKEIMNILANGIPLKKNGYKAEIIAKNKIVSWVCNFKPKKRYTHANPVIEIKK